MLSMSQPSAPQTTTLAYADVLVPRHLSRAFTYLVPSHLQGLVRIGERVIVPFGASVLTGVVIGVQRRPPPGVSRAQLKAIRAVSCQTAGEQLDARLLELSRVVSEYYLAPWGQCLKLILPPSRARRRAVPFYAITDLGRSALSNEPSLSAASRAMLHRLRRRSSGVRETSLVRDAPSAKRSLLALLVRRGWVRREDRLKTDETQPRTPAAVPLQGGHRTTSSTQQMLLDFPEVSAEWSASLSNALESPSKPLLLEVPFDRQIRYLCSAIQMVNSRGRSALIITGQIEGTARLASEIQRVLGFPVIQWHSGLSTPSRAAAWDAAGSDGIHILVGTRSAIFIPLRAVGLIWVDGEDDPALKEEQTPHYHAREVAIIRAGLDRAALVLTSNHAMLETRLACGVEQTPAVLPPCDQADPAIQVVDLRQFPRGTVLSPRLLDSLTHVLHEKGKAVLYLNRKGFATVLLCRECGAMPTCAACSVSLTYHKRSRRLGCSYCGRSVGVPDVCPSCQAPMLEPVGSGTECIEEEVRRRFPDARVCRLDKDLAREPALSETLLRRLSEGEFDVVVGTQLILQRARVPTVQLVAVLQADAGLQTPDFRSAERTYHHLLDAERLAQSRVPRGELLIQTYLPHHHAIEAVAKRDPTRFYATELAFRRVLGYPPFSSLIRLEVSGSREAQVAQAAATWAHILRTGSVAHGDVTAGERQVQGDWMASSLPETESAVTVIGPAPAPLSLARQRHRWHLLVAAKSRELANRVVRQSLPQTEQEWRKGGLKFDVDVDPICIR